jgi:type VI secretion system secreted protein Hcp
MPIYMKIEGIDGDVSANHHSKWIELESCQLGLSQSSHASGGGGGAGKVSFQDLHCTAMTSTASPILMQSCCEGKHFADAQLDFVAPNDDGRAAVYMKIKLTDVLISGYQLGGSGQDRPVDQISLNFATAQTSVEGGDPAGGTAGFCDGSVRSR